MLDTCLSFATQHLTFNPDKTQVIKFCKCADAIAPHFTFLGQSLCLRNSVTHLGHIHNLSDSEDISISKDMCRKANCMLQVILGWGSEDFQRAAPYNERQKLEKRQVLTKGSQEAKRCTPSLPYRYFALYC